MTAAPTLHGRLAALAEVDGARPAYIWGDESFTYSALVSRVSAMSRQIEESTEPGNVVALMAWNGPWWIEALFAVPMARRSLAFVSPRLTAVEVEAMVDAADARLVIVDDARWADGMSSLASRRRSIKSLSSWRAETDVGGSSDIEPVASDTDDIAWLVFTSGTTGRPKAAAHSHRNLLAAVEVLLTRRPCADDDVYMFPFPMWHIAAYNVVAKLLAGRPTVLQPRFEPERIVDDIERHSVTSVSLAATMLDGLVRLAEDDERARRVLASLREVYYGAAPMPIGLLQRANRLLGVDWWQGYGMTELAGNAVFLDPEDHRLLLAGDDELAGATGRPGPGVEAKVVGTDDQTVAAGELGEILVRGPQTMAGYWNDRAATEQTITSDGWLRTGDIGTLGATGILHVLDRAKDVIITGGENVSAREVEEVLRDHPAVADVAVIGLPDPVWGEAVCAVVVPSAGQPEGAAALERHARERLAGFKVPRRFVERGALPVNASGKVVKADLRRWVLEDLSP